MRSSDYPQRNIVKNAVNDLNRGHKFKPTPPPASSKPIKNSSRGLDIKPVPPPTSAKPKYKDEYQRLISSPPGRPAPFPPSQSDNVEYVTFGGEVNENIYDPVYSRGGTLNNDGRPNFPPPQQSDQVRALHGQVDECRTIAQENVQKVLQRDEKLSNLDRRADELHQGAVNFKSGANKLKRKVWWRNFKMWLILGIVIFAILLIIIVSAVTGKK